MNEISIERVTHALRYPRGEHLTSEQLMNIYEKFGGFDAFTNKKLTPEIKNLRNALMDADNFPVDVYNEIVDNTAKFTARDIDVIGKSAHIFASYDLFRKFWLINPSATLGGLYDLDLTMIVEGKKSVYETVMERLPDEHSHVCKTSQGSTEHFGCNLNNRLFRPDANLRIIKQSHDAFLNKVDERVITDIQDAIFDSTAWMRELYAASSFIRDDHWDKLAEDPKRDVLTAVAGNALIPLELAKQLVHRHKTPIIREYLARNATSKELLQSIWDSTSSSSIRKFVEANPIFTSE